MKDGEDQWSEGRMIGVPVPMIIVASFGRKVTIVSIAVHSFDVFVKQQNRREPETGKKGKR